MDNDTTFQDYLYVIFTKKWLILSIFLAVFGTTCIYTFTATKVYKATATIMVEPERITASSLGGTRVYYPLVNIRNYCEILNSKAVAERAADKLLERGYGFSFLTRPEPCETLLLRRSIKPITESEIIKIEAIGISADEAVAIANTLVDAFMEEQLVSIRKGIAEQRAFLEAQIPVVESDLRESEKKVKEFKERHKIVSLPDEVQELAKELAEFDGLYGRSEAAYKSLENRLASLRNQLAEQKSTLVEEITRVSSPYILQLRQELTSLETNYSLYMVQGLTEDNPKLVDLKKSIEGTKTKLVEEAKKLLDKQIPSLDPLSSSQLLVDDILKLEVELAAAHAEREALLKLRGEAERRLYGLPESEFNLAQLERERQANANAYELLMRSYKEAQISEAGIVSNVRVVDRAGTSRVPVKPRKRLNLAIGFVLGVVLGVGGALVIDYVGASIKTEKDIRVAANLPVLGTIPRTSRPNLIDHSSRSHIAEAYRKLRTNIGFASPDEEVKAILITSAVPREGKSTVASNLGIVMTQLGKKVLLVDSDLRKPVLGKFFELETGAGLTNVLIKEVDFLSAISSTKIEGLSLLVAGKEPPNPAELLGSKQMDVLITSLKGAFDYIIFDSPPVASVTDPALLSTKLDGVLLVVEANKTNKLALTHAKEAFDRVNARVLGVVLNKVPAGYTPYGYPHYYSYYRYYTDKGEARPRGVRP